MDKRRKLLLAVAAALAIGGVITALIVGGTGNGRENSALSMPSPTAANPTVSPASPSASPSPATSGDPTSTAPTTEATPGATEPVEGTAPPGEAPPPSTVQQPVNPPIDLKATATVVQGVQARITDIEAVQGEARGIGEVAGPAVRFRVVVENSTGAAISTEQVVVNVSAGAEDTPALPLSGPGVEGFPPAIEPGTTASATYVYLIPNEQRNVVRIFFNFRIDVPVASFEGPVPPTGSTP
jgi:hypothetical protein